MTLRYEASKEIAPGGERHDLRFLGLIRTRMPDASVGFRLIVSSSEKPEALNIGEGIYYPDTFSDSRDAREMYDSISSLHDFTTAVEDSRRKSRRMRI